MASGVPESKAEEPIVMDADEAAIAALNAAWSSGALSKQASEEEEEEVLTETEGACTGVAAAPAPAPLPRPVHVASPAYPLRAACYEAFADRGNVVQYERNFAAAKRGGRFMRSRFLYYPLKSMPRYLGMAGPADIAHFSSPPPAWISGVALFYVSECENINVHPEGVVVRSIEQTFEDAAAFEDATAEAAAAEASSSGDANESGTGGISHGVDRTSPFIGFLFAVVIIEAHGDDPEFNAAADDAHLCLRQLMPLTAAHAKYSTPPEDGNLYSHLEFLHTAFGYHAMKEPRIQWSLAASSDAFGLWLENVTQRIEKLRTARICLCGARTLLARFAASDVQWDSFFAAAPAAQNKPMQFVSFPDNSFSDKEHLARYDAVARVYFKTHGMNPNFWTADGMAWISSALEAVDSRIAERVAPFLDGDDMPPNPAVEAARREEAAERETTTSAVAALARVTI